MCITEYNEEKHSIFWELSVKLEVKLTVVSKSLYKGLLSDCVAAKEADMSLD